MSGLTTHVLDTMSGKPAAGLKVELWVRDDAGWTHVKSVVTDHDGRLSAPLLDAGSMRAGCYELRFHAAEYLQDLQLTLPEPPFLDVVPVRFGISDPAAHYHVPLLLSPYGYSTYRGS